MITAELESRVSNLKSTARAAEWQLETAAKNLATSEQSLDQVVKKSLVLEASRKFVEALATSKEQAFKTRLQKLVQYGLDSVFGAGIYTFVVRIGTFQGKRSIELGFTDNPANPEDEESFTDVVESHGGSVVVIVSYFLQVALLLFSQNRRIILADEKFLMLDDVNSTLLPEIISQVSEKLGIQTILVTHELPLAESCRVCYRLEKSPDGAKIGSKKVLI